MMGCDRSDEVQRYHDGELKFAERSRLEAHFQACAECRQTLRDLAKLSALLASAAGVDPGPHVLARLQKTSRTAARDHGIIRLAGWLTAAAAAVLIGALLLRPEPVGEMVALPDGWETVAVRPTPEEFGTGSLVTAQWLTDELSPSEQR